MRWVFFSGVAVAGMLASTPAIAGPEGMAAANTVTRAASGAHRWGTRIDGRWHAGSEAPGGWSAYRRPAYGSALPSYWMQPDFYIADFGAYELPAPQAGYGWSRYYDDAVLTDTYGRVYAMRGGVAWDRHEGGYDDAPARATPRRRDAPPPPGADEGYAGRWVGTWYGDDGRVYEGEYRGSYEGIVRGQDVAPPPPHGGPHWGPPPPPIAYPGTPYAGTTTVTVSGPAGVRTYQTGPGTTTIVVEPCADHVDDGPSHYHHGGRRK